jgi:hypothetical protein
MRLSYEQITAIQQALFTESQWSGELVHISPIEADHVRAVYVRQGSFRAVVDVDGSVAVVGR